MDFDHYVLAMAWEPEWAASACPGGVRPNALLVGKMSSTSRLGLHGLWPAYSPERSGAGWPEWCNTCASSDCDTCWASESCNFKSCASTMAPKCEVAASAIAVFNTTYRWQTSAVQFAWGSLARHEWARHGSCSPWHADSGSYFDAAEAAFMKSGAGQGAALLERSIGGTADAEALRAAFAADTGARPALVCTPSCRLSEVRVGLPKLAWGGAYDGWPGGGIDVSSSDTCAALQCDRLAVAVWTGCGAAPGGGSGCTGRSKLRQGRRRVGRLCRLPSAAAAARGARLARRRERAEQGAPRHWT